MKVKNITSKKDKEALFSVDGVLLEPGRERGVSHEYYATTEAYILDQVDLGYALVSGIKDFVSKYPSSETAKRQSELGEDGDTIGGNLPDAEDKTEVSTVDDAKKAEADAKKAELAAAKKAEADAKKAELAAAKKAEADAKKAELAAAKKAEADAKKAELAAAKKAEADAKKAELAAAKKAEADAKKAELAAAKK